MRYPKSVAKRAVRHAAELGMASSTARSKLCADLLFHFIAKLQIPCFRCGEPMSRDDFSIEHKEPWLGATNAVELYFDIDNISFSHQSCNSSAKRRPPRRKYSSAEEAKEAQKKQKKEYWTPARRRTHYLKTGR